jgi:hypothetical protein
MRQTIIVVATTALITAVVAIWGTTVIIANTNGPDAVVSSDQTQLMQAIRDANSRADEKADPLD